MVAQKTTPAAQFAEFVSLCRKEGFKWEIRFQVLTITKHFAPESKEAYVEADMVAEQILSLAPLRGGSVWGTTSDGVGGYVAIRQGCYTLNKSGTAKRFIAELGKIRA